MQTALETTPVGVDGEIVAVPVYLRQDENSPANTVAANTAAANTVAAKPVTLSPAEWARQVLGITAPFGHDHLPTVWG